MWHGFVLDPFQRRPDMVIGVRPFRTHPVRYLILEVVIVDGLTDPRHALGEGQPVVVRLGAEPLDDLAVRGVGLEREIYNNDTIERLHAGVELLLSTGARFVKVQPMQPDEPPPEGTLVVADEIVADAIPPLEA